MTPYDRVSSWMITIFAGLMVLCLFVVLVWISNQIPKPPEAVPVEFLELPGGVEDGSPDESLRLDSPLPERPDASAAEVSTEHTDVETALDAATELSDVPPSSVAVTGSNPVAPQQFDTGSNASGVPGSSKGTGKKRALGFGPGSRGGFPREQRWFVRFGDRSSVEEYARQLDFFQIELGALMSDGRLAYVSKLSSPMPQIRYVQTGANEKRLYMTWQGGERRGADTELFQKAGVAVGPDTPIFHFYPPDLESKLAALEREYRNKPVKEIRRTYFSVEDAGGRYQLKVTRQLLQ